LQANRELVFEFALMPPVNLPMRSILTVHVQSRLHHDLWGMHNTAGQFLHTMQETTRVNFHISVDGII
jgi:hypothetical protein